MSSDEFLRIAALASLAPPDGEARTRTFVAARKVLGAYASQVVETARGGDAEPSRDPEDDAACPLRADEPQAGFPEGTAFELAPERGERLIQVPRILGGGSS